MRKLTQARLKELLYYDPKTGIFTRKKRVTNSVYIGDIAGCLNIHGYLRTTIDGINYLNHRLVWLYLYGCSPEGDIDHINRIKTDNREINLRDVSRQCNLRNSKLRKDNISGVKGVSRSAPTDKWHSRIVVLGKNRSLGYYKDFDNAVCARLAGEQCLNWSGCDISSPAYKYVQKQIINKGV